MQTILNNLQHQHLLRTRHMITDKHPAVAIINRKKLINFCSNDYLSLANHASVKRAFAKGIDRYGAGSGSSSLVAGYTRAHAKLERTFADFLQRERALLFNSGYHANLGVISALADRHSTIIADKYSHASLIDGIILSRARHYRYQHNNLIHAKELALRAGESKIFFITESLFSMHGDITDLPTLALISKHHKAQLIVDDAHGFGVLNQSHAAIDCLITPLGKAVASFGAIVSGQKELIEVILQRARTYRYSTALPPAVCNASLQALKILQTESWRRIKLAELIRIFIQETKKYNLPLMSFDATPIKSILIGSNKLALALQKNLFAHGFFTACIRPPTVPNGQACLRISLNCQHEEPQISSLLKHIKIFLEKHAKTY